MASVLSCLAREPESNVHPKCINPCERLKVLIACPGIHRPMPGGCEPAPAADVTERMNKVNGVDAGMCSGCFPRLVDCSGPRPRFLHLRS